jgi:hypothetical protein
MARHGPLLRLLQVFDGGHRCSIQRLGCDFTLNAKRSKVLFTKMMIGQLSKELQWKKQTPRKESGVVPYEMFTM